MDKKHLLILVHLDRYQNDIADNKFSRVGDVVVAKEFSRDIDITKGIYGVPWGYTEYFDKEDIYGGFWAVVKTEYNDNIIPIDKFYNTVKFRSGIILHIGTLQSASKFIIKSKRDESHYYHKSANLIPDEEIAGHKKWMEKYENSRKNLLNGFA